MKTIRISMEVWEMLKRLATPLEDSPDSVLKRVLRSVLGNVPATSRVIEHRTNGFSKVPGPPKVPQNQSVPPNPELQKTNKQKGREKGRRYRRILLKQLESEGIFLTRIRENIYNNSKGETIGIPYSSEQRPNEWFLGLPENNYHYLIFLCEKDSHLLSFIIPKRFYEHINFSKCKRDGDMKFNITEMNNDYYLDSPGKGKVPITEFLYNYQILK